MKKFVRHRKWITLATLTGGTIMQLSACQDEAALFGLRVAFTSITLPINVLIRDVLQIVI